MLTNPKNCEILIDVIDFYLHYAAKVKIGDKSRRNRIEAIRKECKKNIKK